MTENLRLSFRGIMSHKMRSFLTMLGIIIGIAAIIAIVSTIQGTNEQIQKNLIGSGVNNVNVQFSLGDWPYDFTSGVPAGIPVISGETLEQLKAVEHAESVSLYTYAQDYDGVSHGANTVSGGYVYGIGPEYFGATGLTIRKGRGISKSDIDGFHKVCVLDDSAIQSLFPCEDPVGMTVEIHGEPFTVVGIAAEKTTFEPNITSIDDYNTYSSDQSGKVYVPSSTWPVIYRYDQPQNVIIRADSTKSMTEVGKAAESILNSTFSSDEYTYKARDIMEQAKQIQQLSQSTNTMLLWIAAISLLVGGIGVMNIMLVSVTERTSEIGLKKAIGAPKKAIMMQFLTEAVVLTSAGGVLGVIVGIVLAGTISRINTTPVAISIPASVFAVLFSMAIGIIFGILPSRKAANLDPIEALRRE